jgi:hypothetical protein
MLPAQQMHILQQQQQALDQEAIQQEQQRIQEVQQLQAQLQQLLQQQQQQMRAQQPAAPQQQLQYVNMHRSSNNGTSLLLPSGTLAPDFQGQMQVLLQPAAGMGGALQQQPSAQGPFATMSCAPDPSQQSCVLSVSALGPAGTDLSTACALPNLQSADYTAQQQQLQAQMQMPILHGASGPFEDDDDDKQVAALDEMISQCMSRLLRLRGQISARRAVAAPVGSTCSTPTATPATGNTATHGVFSSAAGLTADSLLMQPMSASQPLLLAHQMQQQHSGMLSPASSMGGQLLPHQQQPLQQIVSNGRVMWVQQQQPVGAGAGGNTVLVSAPGFGVPLQQMGSACLTLPPGSSCNAAGAYVAQSMPLLMQQQSPMAVLGQQQQQVMVQPVGGQLTASFSGNDGRSSHSGYFSPAAGAGRLLLHICNFRKKG